MAQRKFWFHIPTKTAWNIFLLLFIVFCPQHFLHETGRWLQRIGYFNWSVRNKEIFGTLDTRFISLVWTCCKSWCVINGFSGENKFFYSIHADWEKAGKGGLISLNSYKNAFKIISLLWNCCWIVLRWAAESVFFSFTNYLQLDEPGKFSLKHWNNIFALILN